MARWNDLPWREDVYKAAEKWRETCFFNDGSIFDNGDIWTKGNIEPLIDRILDNPDPSGDSDFFEKLEAQLNGAPKESVLLMAEIMWFIYLFPIGRQPKITPSDKPIRISTGWNIKRKRISRILSLVDETPPDIPVTSIDALSGIGRTGGQAYNDYFDAIKYLLPVLLQWKQVPLNERLAYQNVDKCWDFAELIDQKIVKTSPPWRHALLFFLYPDKFERMVSTKHKRNLVKHFGPRLNIETSQSTLLETDKAIYEIRNRLTTLFPDEAIDFYLKPIQVDGNWINLAFDSEVTENAPSYDDVMASKREKPDRPEEEQKFTEGERKIVIHDRAERAPGLRQKKIKQFLKTNSELYCENCGETATGYPKDIRTRVFEVHHIIPISQYDGSQITNMDNLALLCANCHRAIHYWSPPPTLEVFKDKLAGLNGKK